MVTQPPPVSRRLQVTFMPTTSALPVSSAPSRPTSGGGLLGRALAVPAGIAVVVAIAMGLTIFAADASRAALHRYQAADRASQQAAEAAERDFYTWDDQLNMLVLVKGTAAKDSSLYQATKSQADQAGISLAGDLSQLRSVASTPVVAQAASRLAGDVSGYRHFADEVAADLARGAVAAAAKVQTIDNLDVSNALMDDAAAALKAASVRADQRLAAIRSSQSLVRTIAVVTAVVTIGALLLLMWLFTHGVLAPIRAVGRVLDEVAHGRLTGRVEVSGGNEIGQMAQSLNTAVGSVRSTIEAIEQSSVGLNAASAQLLGTAGQMRTSAERTATEAGRVAASAETISSTVQAMADNGGQMEAAITEIARSAGQAAEVAGSAVELATDTTGVVGHLATSSAQIRNVVKLITSIAEQTNLLALNATIESARAGEAGKGFAVVAGEVKDLARETADATGDISRRIDSLQSDSADAVAAIEQIAGVISQISTFQSAIAAAVDQQRGAIQATTGNVGTAATGVSGIVSSIDRVAAEAAATAGQVAQQESAAAELATTAEALHRQVARFEI